MSDRNDTTTTPDEGPDTTSGTGATPGGRPGVTPAASRPPGGPGGGRGMGPGAHLGMALPVAKPRDFKGSIKRLGGYLKPQAVLIAIVLVFAAASVFFSILGPKMLGTATNIVFEGVVGKQIPATNPLTGQPLTKDEAVAGLKAQGNDTQAAMLESMDVTPGQGVDFAALHRQLLLVALVYLLSAILMWAQQYLMAGVAQKIIYNMRRQVDEKLARLPLRYFDDNSRGDILSRVTNDIDNISQTLGQSLTQIITAVLTIIGVMIMMFSISPLLAGVSLLIIPLSIVVTILIARQSQKQFSAQWERTGNLNGHVEEMHTGHSIVKVFGRQEEAIQIFDAENERLYDASFKAQFISGIIMPAMNFINNLNYVAIAVIGGLLVANGRLSLGDVQAFIQYSRQFTQPISQTASIANVLQSTVASAERVFELLDEAEEKPDTAQPVRLSQVAGHIAGHIVIDNVSFRYDPETPLIEDLSLDARPGSTVAIVGPTGAGKTTLVNLLMRFYEIDHGSISIDGVDTRDLTRDELRRQLRHGAAGYVAVQRHHPGEHRLRPRRLLRGRHPGRRAGGVRRSLRANAACRIRHGAQRRCVERLGG